MDHPSVGVVVVNYNGGDLTLACLRSLLATKWPAPRLRVVLVDNASSDGVVARVRTELPVVDVLERATNGGFGAGCNDGIRALGNVDFVALVNNDATVGPDWLAPLVDALEADPGLGAACPKILYAGRFVELSLQSETVRRGRGDDRDLGVLLSGARVDGEDVWRRAQLVEGFWGPDPAAGASLAQWTSAGSTLRLPVDDGGSSTATLLLSADRPTRVGLRSGERAVEHDVDTTARWLEAPLDGAPIDVVNNVGTVLTAEGYGADRGRFEPDDGRYDAPADVFAWCGGAVLLRSTYLDEVGAFDERLFLYYEDLELSWRGTERGWRYRSVPASVVRHIHAATSVEGSSFKSYYDERNHLLVLARHATAVETARAALRSLLVTASYAKRDLIATVLTGRAPQSRIVRDRLSAFASFAVAWPSIRRSRAFDDGLGHGLRACSARAQS